MKGTSTASHNSSSSVLLDAVDILRYTGEDEDNANADNHEGDDDGGASVTRDDDPAFVSESADQDLVDAPDRVRSRAGKKIAKPESALAKESDDEDSLVVNQMSADQQRKAGKSKSSKAKTKEKTGKVKKGEKKTATATGNISDSAPPAGYGNDDALAPIESAVPEQYYEAPKADKKKKRLEKATSTKKTSTKKSKTTRIYSKGSSEDLSDDKGGADPAVDETNKVSSVDAEQKTRPSYLDVDSGAVLLSSGNSFRRERPSVSSVDSTTDDRITRRASADRRYTGSAASDKRARRAAGIAARAVAMADTEDRVEVMVRHGAVRVPGIGASSYDDDDGDDDSYYSGRHDSGVVVGDDAAGIIATSAVRADDLEAMVRDELAAGMLTAEIVASGRNGEDQNDDNDGKGSKRDRRSKKLLIVVSACLCLLVVAIVGGVVAAVVVSGGSGDDGDTQGDALTSTASPRSDPVDNVIDIIADEPVENEENDEEEARPVYIPPDETTPAGSVYAFLAGISRDGGTMLTDPSSSQHSAYLWLADDYGDQDVSSLTETERNMLKTRYALATLYFMTGGDTEWLDATGWLGPESVCEWYMSPRQIEADNEGGDALPCSENGDVLLELRLFSNNLVGMIPPELGMLSGLKVLDLSENRLNSGLPLSFGNADHFGDLEIFDVHGNLLTGTIHKEYVSNWPSIEKFDISDNSFTSAVRKDVCEVVFLQYFVEIAADCNEVECFCCSICCTDGVDECEYIDIYEGIIYPPT